MTLTQEGNIGACYAAYLETTVHPEDRAGILSDLRIAVSEQRPFVSRYRVRLADGTVRTLRDRGRTVRDADGTARRLLGVTHDVTDWPHPDAALSATRPGLPAPGEAGSLQGLLVHRGGIPLYANRRLARLLGYQSAEDLLARFAHRGLVAGAPPDGQERELALPRADGATLWVQTASHRVQWDGMSASQVAVVDITARKRLEAELEQMRAIGATGALASGLVHDFNNLLQIVIGFAGMLAREVPATGPFRTHAERILHAAERGSRLVRKLLTLGARGGVVLDDLDVNETMGAMVDLIQPTLPGRYRLEFRPEAGLPVALADATALEQILLNLLLNARDAMPDGGTLALETAGVELTAAQAAEIRGARPGSFVRITVRDTGQGMAEAVQERMCEPFFSTKSAQAGSGLGLSVVNSLVAAQRGFLGAESQEGAGTSVHVFLPLAPARGLPISDAEPAAPDAEPKSAQGLTVLVAEPDPIVGRLVAGFLEQAGHTALIASDGDDALAQAACHTGRLALVLLSSALRDGNAHEVLAGLQGMHPNLPVVITTSGAPTPAETFLDVASGRPALRKPFHLRELLAAVETSQRSLTIV